MIHAVVGEDYRLIIDLPPDMPTGSITVTVVPTESIATAESSSAAYVNPERERLRAILLAAGKLGTAHMPPPDMIFPTEEAIHQAGILPTGARPSEDIVRELRDDE